MPLKVSAELIGAITVSPNLADTLQGWTMVPFTQMPPKWGSGQIVGKIFVTVTLTLILAIQG